MPLIKQVPGLLLDDNGHYCYRAGLVHALVVVLGLWALAVTGYMVWWGAHDANWKVATYNRAMANNQKIDALRQETAQQGRYNDQIGMTVEEVAALEKRVSALERRR